jgi:hypothetical protein
VNEFFAGLVGRAAQRVPVLERRPRSRFEPVASRGPAIELDGAAPADADDLDGVTDGRDGPAGEPSGARRREPAAGRASVRVPPLDGAAAPAPLALASPAVLAREVQPEAIDEPAAVARLEPALASRSISAPAAIPLAPVDRLEPAHAGAAPEFAAPELHRPLRAAVTPSVRPSLAEPAAVTPIPRGARHGSAATSGSPSAASPRFATHATHAPQAPRDVDGQPDRSAVPGGPGAPALRTLPSLLAPRAASPLAQAAPAPIARPAVDRGTRPNGPAAVSPPPIHVTIGRIEVRATTPAADRPIRRAPPQPRLSLEDYLSGRRGGAR